MENRATRVLSFCADSQPDTRWSQKHSTWPQTTCSGGRFFSGAQWLTMVVVEVEVVLLVVVVVVVTIRIMMVMMMMMVVVVVMVEMAQTLQTLWTRIVRRRSSQLHRSLPLRPHVERVFREHHHTNRTFDQTELVRASLEGELQTRRPLLWWLTTCTTSPK